MSSPLIKLFNEIAFFIASGFYSGKTPKSPGTAGSLLCIVIWFLNRDFLKLDELTLIIGTILLGLLTSQISLHNLRKKDLTTTDPQTIVIDEWAGMLIALYAIPTPTIFWVITAFILFRFFDILKLGPIRWSEKLPDSIGIMADDIVAGLFSALTILLLKYILNFL